MGFLSVQTYGFRNLSAARIPLGASRVFLIGENGQGKTNFLESVYLLCFGSSFRTAQDGEMIHLGMEAAQVQGVFRVEEGMDREVLVRLHSGERKEVSIDYKPVRDRREMLHNIPCILFSPHDLQFISGGPDRRRWFFNQTASLLDPVFFDDLRSYQKILRSRNTLLREGKAQLLDLYDQQLVRYGTSIQARRQQIVREFNETFSALFGRISGLEEPLVIEYRPSWGGSLEEADLLGRLAGRRPRDLRLGSTTSGPHRDGFVFRLGQKDFLPLASTGQVRLCALILRAAQANFFHAKTGRTAVLLLDDVLLELDARKREAFLSELPPCEQAFFTFLPDEPYDRYRTESTLQYRVRAGTFEPMM